MRSRNFPVGTIMVALVGLGVFGIGARAAAQTETVLYSFLGGNDGQNPSGAIASDAAGNLYGATVNGGAYGQGTVFELVRNSSGGWTESVLYTFTAGADGREPEGGVVVDASGNVYGTTSLASTYNDGTVWELTPASGGGWAFNTIHTFSGPDGAQPYSGLILDAAGNLYGTTSGGGTDGWGVVFELKPSSDGTWNEGVLHSFTGQQDQGVPMTSLVFDTAGNLYGTNIGISAWGVVFELTPQVGGGWKTTVLHQFNGDGEYPRGALVVDSAGNLYGTTYQGGSGNGIAYELLRNSSGRWWLDVLWRFSGGTDGGYPFSALTFDAAGNLYGVTPAGGTSGNGVIFKLFRHGRGPMA